MPDPSILVTLHSLDDASLAPPGCSTLYALEPVPNLDGRVDWTSHRPRAVERLRRRVAAAGYPTDVVTEEIYDPLDWEALGMERGTPFALAHTFRQTGPFRPRNVDPSRARAGVRRVVDGAGSRRADGPRLGEVGRGPGARPRSMRPAVCWLPASATAVAMVAFPLARRGGGGRRALAHAVVGSLFTTTTAAAARRWGWARAGTAALAVTLATATVERVGTATGVPFGRYHYTGRLRAVVAGVPVVVPLAWWAMAVPAREAASAALGGRSRPAGRIALGAAALTAWDLFLDPQMTAEDYWRWQQPGAYRGIPLSNYAGWLAHERRRDGDAGGAAPDRPRRRRARRGVRRHGRHGGRSGSRPSSGTDLVAAVGGAAMLPIAALAAARWGDG